MKVEGACHCGSITYEAEVDPARVSICHCTDCQALSGTAFRVSVPAAEGSFRLHSGTPRVYVKTAESGRQRAQGFCADCGTPIYAAPAGPDPSVYVLRLGPLKQRDALPPRRQIWHASAQGWLGTIETLPAAEREA